MSTLGMVVALGEKIISSYLEVKGTREQKQLVTICSYC